MVRRNSPGFVGRFRRRGDAESGEALPKSRAEIGAEIVNPNPPSGPARNFTRQTSSPLGYFIIQIPSFPIPFEKLFRYVAIHKTTLYLSRNWGMEVDSEGDSEGDDTTLSQVEEQTLSLSDDSSFYGTISCSRV